jgi:hypothetical protein
MSVRRTLGVVGAVLAGTVTASGSDVPPADPRVVRALLVEIGLLRERADEAAVTGALRRFQSGAGLAVDGMAGPRTCHALTRYAREARELNVPGVMGAHVEDIEGVLYHHLGRPQDAAGTGRRSARAEGRALAGLFVLADGDKRVARQRHPLLFPVEGQWRRWRPWSGWTFRTQARRPTW